MIRNVMLSIAAVAFLGLLPGVPGCGKSDSSSGSASEQPAKSSIEKEAQAAALAEFGRHWVKAPDGWITARVSGSAYSPDHFVRQIRELNIDSVEADQQTDADRLNGVEWSGTVTFKMLPCREAGDPGLVLDGMVGLGANRPARAMVAMGQFLPEGIRLQKQKGQWQINQDTWLLRGTIPTSADYAKAGIKG